jgi:hypothetical protein
VTSRLLPVVVGLFGSFLTDGDPDIPGAQSNSSGGERQLAEEPELATTVVATHPRIATTQHLLGVLGASAVGVGQLR